MSQTGECMCGAVRVEVTGAFGHLHACHCDSCRRWTGTAFIGTTVAIDAMRADGPIKTLKTSDWAERSWCDTYGSTLWYRLTLPGHESYSLSAGLFDNAAGQDLDLEYYIDRKPAGYAYTGDHKRLTKTEVEAMFADVGQEVGQ